MSLEPQDVIAELKAEKNVLLYGPPACGKTRLLHLVQTAMGGSTAPGPFDASKSKGFLQTSVPGPKWWVTFHQSYSYEDFVVGLRTVPTTGSGVSIQPVIGPLLEAALYAQAGKQDALVVIDEINRGNTSRILGEAITIMEKDKRAGMQYEVKVRLPHIPTSGMAPEFTLSTGAHVKANLDANFALPANVYLLAAMNSVDRTVAPLDAALRRRFHVIEMGPDVNVLTKELKIDLATDFAETPTTSNHWKALAVKAWQGLNQRIKEVAGKDFMLGHGYLTGLPDTTDATQVKKAIAATFNRKIMPQLEEEFKDNEASLFHVMQSDDGAPVDYPVLRADTGDVEGVRTFQAETKPWTSNNLDKHLLHLVE